MRFSLKRAAEPSDEVMRFSLRRAAKPKLSKESVKAERSTCES